MEKILTISIASYNVEKYIKATLDSIVSSKYIDELEVFVVDDGGTDQSLTIAKEYSNQYPLSIFPAHKENGGYGTTVNYSINHATGKYFKLLDGDDWFNTEGLDALIEFIKNNDADMFITDVLQVVDGVPTIKPLKYQNYDGKVVDVEEVGEDVDFGMWGITFNTSLVKKLVPELPKHSLYTDVLYSTYPMEDVQKVGFLSKYVYCYRLGRDEQSVSRVSRNKHYMEYQNIVETLKRVYNERNISKKSEFVKSRFFRKYKLEIFNLLLLPPTKEVKQMIINIEKDTKSNYPEFYECAATESKKIRLLRYSNYLAYYILSKYADNNF